MADNIDSIFIGKLKQIFLLNQSTVDFLFVGLIGSYGRGEGRIFCEGELFTSLNDLDILVVTRIPLTSLEKESVLEAVRKVYKGWLDIDFLLPNSKRFKTPSIWLTDIINSHVRIIGNIESIDELEIVDTNVIPKKEALILWRTRMWTFWSQDYFVESRPKSDYQLAKLVFAIIDITCLPNGYKSTYLEKSNSENARKIFDEGLLFEALSVKNGEQVAFENLINTKYLIKIMLIEIARLYTRVGNKSIGFVITCFHPNVWISLASNSVSNKSVIPFILYAEQLLAVYMWVFWNKRIGFFNKYLAEKSLQCQKKN